MEILVWINMGHSACPQKISPWMLFGPSMKIFASPRLMGLEPDLTCWQTSDRATDLLVNGIMLFKPKCLLPSTHQKLQVSCIETINDSNIDLEKFPASKVRQLVKKMESTKLITRQHQSSCKWPPNSSS